METFDLINRVTEEIMSEVGYCGSCMGGCDPKTKFICMGGSGNTINKWVESHSEVVDNWEVGIDSKIPEVAQSAKRSVIMTNVDVVINWIYYIIKDISSYDELTESEKEFITPEVFNQINKSIKSK